MFSKKNVQYEALSLPDRFDFSEQEMLSRTKAFLDNMQKRHSVRQFDTKPVVEEVIQNAIKAAGSAPSGANHQPWHFVAISNPEMKKKIRLAAEEEEKAFYAGGGGDEWLKALEPIGTDESKPHLEDAPWLIVIFSQRFGIYDDGSKFKNYYVPESVGIATGMLITALHQAGLSMLTHTPNPMRFLNGLCDRPDHEKPTMILTVGHPSTDAVVPAVAKLKKPFSEIATVFN
ncbi:nitroreductase family protein [Hirschia maritima]|uniref:nitroreductase family protein n=1 Tax=Hirschia maritima TaxID=1121961 RepID=UPI000374524C|nr:nitroreductase family protein [Hirschia maritima]